jgi:hypothetical protein
MLVLDGLIGALRIVCVVVCVVVRIFLLRDGERLGQNATQRTGDAGGSRRRSWRGSVSGKATSTWPCAECGGVCRGADRRRSRGAVPACAVNHTRECLRLRTVNTVCPKRVACALCGDKSLLRCRWRLLCVSVRSVHRPHLSRSAPSSAAPCSVAADTLSESSGRRGAGVCAGVCRCMRACTRNCDCVRWGEQTHLQGVGQVGHERLCQPVRCAARARAGLRDRRPGGQVLSEATARVSQLVSAEHGFSILSGGQRPRVRVVAEQRATSSTRVSPGG